MAAAIEPAAAKQGLVFLRRIRGGLVDKHIDGFAATIKPL
jgi:hypothetical protein